MASETRLSCSVDATSRAGSMASSSDTAIPAGRGFAGASASHGVAFAAGNPDADRHHVDDEEAGAEETESDSEVEQEITLIEEGGNLPPEHDHAHPHEKRVTPGLLDRLPIHEFEDQVLERIALQKVTIVCGETGCGKSTAVPHFLIRDSVARGLHRPRIVVAQ